MARGMIDVMLRVVARDGDALLIADGDVGASVLPDGRILVQPVASLTAHGDWEPSTEPLPRYTPADLAEQIAAFRAAWTGQP